MKELDEIRRAVDEIDDRIVALLAERFALAKRASVIRQWDGIQRDVSREGEIVARLRERGGYAPRTVEAVYRELFDGAPREASIGE